MEKSSIYEEPRIIVTEVSVEKGFAESGGATTNEMEEVDLGGIE